MPVTALSSSTKTRYLSQTTSTFADTVVPQGSSRSTAPVSSSSFSSANPSDKTGVIVGGVIGGVAVLALLTGIIAWICMHYNRRNSASHEIAQAAWTGQTHSREDVVPENNRIYEINAHSPRSELEHSMIAELENRMIAELEPRSFVELGNSPTLHKR